MLTLGVNRAHSFYLHLTHFTRFQSDLEDPLDFIRKCLQSANIIYYLNTFLIVFSYSTTLVSITITSETAALTPLVDNVEKCAFKRAKEERETYSDHLQVGIQK